MSDCLLEQNTYCGKKFTYKNEEYLRIQGVWFKWKNDIIEVYKKCDELERLYKLQYND